MKLHLASSLHHGVMLVITMGWDRLVLAVAIIIAVVVLTLAGKITGEATIGILSAIVGYVVGAGHEAAKRNGI